MAQFQKLTRNVFFTLQRHNIYRQQRQLSKFLMRYQQFVSHASCGAAGPVPKMASLQEKAERLQTETTTFSLGHPIRRI
jgi:hypothetical protein